jgi:hypothetical protein
LDEVHCSAKVVDGYSTTVGAHRQCSGELLLVDLPLLHVVVGLLLLWLENSCILHTTITLAALMMKTFLHKNCGNCSHSSQSKVDPNANASQANKSVSFQTNLDIKFRWWERWSRQQWWVMVRQIQIWKLRNPGNLRKRKQDESCIRVSQLSTTVEISWRYYYELRSI